MNTNVLQWDMPMIHFTREDYRAILSLAESESLLCRWDQCDHGMTDDRSEEWVNLERPDGSGLMFVRTRRGQCAVIEDGEVLAEAGSVTALVDQMAIEGVNRAGA